MGVSIKKILRESVAPIGVSIKTPLKECAASTGVSIKEKLQREFFAPTGVSIEEKLQREFVTLRVPSKGELLKGSAALKQNFIEDLKPHVA